jgi:PEGA domain
MNCSRALLPAAVLASLSLTVAPVFAQHSRSASGSRGAARSAAPRTYSAPARTYAGPSRSYGTAVRSYSGPSRSYVYGGAPRIAAQSRSVYVSQSRGVYSPSRGSAVVRVAPRIVTRGIYVAPTRFYRPYYSFRPRFSIGFGIWVGYPVAYSYPYYYGYPYGYDPYYPYDRYVPYPVYGPPAPYGYPVPYPSPGYAPGPYPQASAPQSGYYDPNAPQGTVVARPGTASGSISLEISPSTAEVYIDATYVGRVSDLGPSTQPIALTPGRHHVEIRAAGYETLSLDADVTAGQVVPYRGQLQPIR